MRQMVSFGIVAMSIIAVALLVFWGAGVFSALGLDTAGTVALVFGILVTSALGVALMALVFYGEESNSDEDASSAPEGAGESHPIGHQKGVEGRQ